MNEDTVSLKEILNVVLLKKIRIVFVGILFSVLSVVIALSIPNQYTSQSQLIVNNSDSNLSSLASGLGGFASLAGVNLSGGGSDKLLIAQTLLSSQQYQLDFIDKYGLLIPLMSADGWDAENDQLSYNDDYDFKNNAWSNGKPKRESILKEFNKIFKIAEDEQSGKIIMTVTFYSPHLAKKWLANIIHDVNEAVKSRYLAETTESITYLTDLISKTDVKPLRDTFYNLLEEQSKTLMLTQVKKDYVYQIIDPPSLPEKKSKPSRALICIFVTLAGVFLYVFFIVFKFYLDEYWHE